MSNKLVITRYNEVIETLVQRDDIVAVLSIEHPGVKPGDRGAAPKIADFGFEHVPQTVLCFWDSEQTVANGPEPAQIEKGIAFVLEHMEKGTVLIHCLAGKSRSVALALGVLAHVHPDKSADELVDVLLEIRPVAAPNIIIVEMVDTLTGRNGELVRAVKEHPVITEQRSAAEENRQWMLENRPEHFAKVFPEKKFKKD